MDDEKEIFSVRIVVCDHYLTKPIPGIDVTYSEFRGSDIKQVFRFLFYMLLYIKIMMILFITNIYEVVTVGEVEFVAFF